MVRRHHFDSVGHSQRVGQHHDDAQLVGKNTATYGDDVFFYATVAAASPITATPTGTVTFFDGPTVLGTSTLNSSGVATFDTTTLGYGTQNITAYYNGDGSNSALGRQEHHVASGQPAGAVGGQLHSQRRPDDCWHCIRL